MQLGPHTQASPHWQRLREADEVFWQPQVQDGPGQLTQGQVIGWVDMIDSSCSGERLVDGGEYTTRARGELERSGYSSRRVPAAIPYIRRKVRLRWAESANPAW